jgi:hypothetical protein
MEENQTLKNTNIDETSKVSDEESKTQQSEKNDSILNSSNGKDKLTETTISPSNYKSFISKILSFFKRSK